MATNSPSSDDDRTTEALIAQLIAEDMGGDYSRWLYDPIGANFNDYEAPLTSYERQCLEDPDTEDGAGGWNPPTPPIDPDESCLDLPEGQTWDSSCNTDVRVGDTPAVGTPRSVASNEKKNKSDIGINDVTDDRVASDDKDSNPPARPASPILLPSSQPELTRENDSDNTKLESLIPGTQGSPAIEPPKEPTSEMLSRLASIITPGAYTHTTDNPFRPTLSTNERLLQNLPTDHLINTEMPLRLQPPSWLHQDNDIDTSTSKGKGKAPDPSTSDPKDHCARLKAELAHLKALVDADIECHISKDSNHDEATDSNLLEQYNQAKHMLKDFESARPPHLRNREIKIRASIDEDEDEDEDDDEEEYDEKTGLLYLRVPLSGTRLSDRLAERRQRVVDAEVVEIRVGDEETVESILKDIVAREENRSRSWGDWGEDLVRWEGKGKGKAVECV